CPCTPSALSFFCTDTSTTELYTLSLHDALPIYPFENVYLVLAVISSILLMLVVVYYPPLQTIFHTTYLSVREWMLIIVFSSIPRSEEHTSELQSRENLVCRLLLEKKKNTAKDE